MAWPFTFGSLAGGNVPASDLDANFNAAVMGRGGTGYTAAWFSQQLTAAVNITVINTLFVGPQVAQGTSGTFWATGQLLLTDGTANNTQFYGYLNDGVSNFAAAEIFATATSSPYTLTFSAIV